MAFICARSGFPKHASPGGPAPGAALTAVWRLLTNPDVKRRKQAEFLVHQSFPWALVVSIGVLDAAMATQVRAALADAAHKPGVTIESNWYYNP